MSKSKDFDQLYWSDKEMIPKHYLEEMRDLFNVAIKTKNKKLISFIKFQMIEAIKLTNNNKLQKKLGDLCMVKTKTLEDYQQIETLQRDLAFLE